MSSTPVGSPEPPIRVFDGRPMGAPVLVSGFSSAGVLDDSGDLRLIRETRGGLLEWGGVYAQNVRLTGPWEIRLVVPEGVTTIGECRRQLTVHRWGAESLHEWNGLEVRQQIYATDRPPGIVRRLMLSERGGTVRTIRVESEFSPFLGRVIVEGVKPYDYRAQTRGTGIKVSTAGLRLGFDAEPLPSHLCLNQASYIGQPWEGELRSVLSDWDLSIPAHGTLELGLSIWGGVDHLLDSSGDAGRTSLDPTIHSFDSARLAYESWRNGTPAMRLPDAPELEAAYSAARGALRQLYHAPAPGFTGLVAGYPWYSALWSRDQAWMLPAVLWMGDLDWSRESVDTVVGYQAPADVPILGATSGEVPMQVAPGPVFLYGSSDSTLQFVDVVRRWVDHGGRWNEPLSKWYPRLRKMGAWADARAEATTGLEHHGGEVARLRDASGSAGRVHYGFDANDTTIWDSTDRRDHAIDIQVHYWRLLRSMAELGARLGEADEATQRTKRAAELARAIPSLYQWTEESYLYDSRTLAGDPVPRIRPNALLAIAAGLIEPGTAAAMVRRAASSDLLTPWGMRTLSNKDPGYSPTAYHDGQVWTIATVWLAMAAFATNQPELGVAALRTVASLYVQESGLANECYRGDRREPFNSCFLLGFSVAPFLTCLFEGLWGLTPKIADGVLGIRPNFPRGWRRAELGPLTFGETSLSLTRTGRSLEVSSRGGRTLRIETRDDAVNLEPGQTVTVSGRLPSESS